MQPFITDQTLAMPSSTSRRRRTVNSLARFMAAMDRPLDLAMSSIGGRRIEGIGAVRCHRPPAAAGGAARSAAVTIKPPPME